MATQSKFFIQAVETGQAFSDTVTIFADGFPSENLIYASNSIDLDISGVSVSVNKVGNNLVVTVSGTHGLDPFDNVIKHFTRGRSDLWESPLTDDAFSDLDAYSPARQVYNWTPDYNPVTVTYTINYTNNGVPEFKTFTQIVTPNYDSEIPNFLNKI